jgi:NAD(P)-dependent dehydrogenase (short-subunit alcohol dehydrogenase family)
MSTQSLAGSVVTVTGASAGVGRAAARAFADRGAAVALLARSGEGLEAARREVEQRGARAIALPVDLADFDAVDGAAETAERELGPIDVWVNDAMASVFAPVWEVRPEEFRRATEVTYLGAVHGTMAALRRMRGRDRGTIVQVGSALAYRAIPLQSAYCGSKHALRGFTDSVRCELMHERSGVHVTMVHLPALNTPQFDTVRSRLPRRPQPVPPIFQPEVAAEGIVLAAAARRREVWVGGSTVITIAGSKLAPALADRYLARTGFDSQQTDEPADPDRPDNLFEPVPGDRGAHGRFDDRSRAGSLQLRATAHRRKLLAAAAGLATAVAVLGRR